MPVASPRGVAESGIVLPDSVGLALGPRVEFGAGVELRGMGEAAGSEIWACGCWVVPPFQGGNGLVGGTQGVALGYRIRPRGGRNSGGVDGGSGVRRRAGVRGWCWDGRVCKGPNGARGNSPGQSPGVIRRMAGALKGRNGVWTVGRCEPGGIAGACGARAAGSEIWAYQRWVVPPFQGGNGLVGGTQGVALGYRIRPRWGRNSGGVGGWIRRGWVGGSGVGGWGCVRGWVWDGLGCNGPNGARGDSPGQSPGLIRRIVRALKGRDGVCPVVRCEPWGIAGACGAQAAGSEIGALPRATSSGPWGRCHTR